MSVYQATEMATDDFYQGVRHEVIVVHYASTPIEADLIQTKIEGLSPGVLSVNAISPTVIRVTFESPAIDNLALRDPGNYVITPTRAVHEVEPQAVAMPGYVDLTIDEQVTGVAYQVELQRIEAA